MADELIDLTQDSKFIRTTPTVRGIEDPIMKINRIPWRKRAITSMEDLQPRVCRSYGDVLSDEMGCIVRRCSDNTWLFGNPEIKKKSYFEALFTEVLSEVGLKITTVLNICPQCGKRRITHDIFRVCDSCELEQYDREVRHKLFPKQKTKYIGFRDYVWESHFDMDIQQTINIETAPYDIKQQLLN